MALVMLTLMHRHSDGLKRVLLRVAFPLIILARPLRAKLIVHAATSRSWLHNEKELSRCYAQALRRCFLKTSESVCQ